MLIWTGHITKKTWAALAVLVLGALLAAIILLSGRTPETEERLSTNEDRVAYLQSLGWEVETEPVETLRFLMPEILTEPYRSYNELQLSQGFDLAVCLGKQVTRYTYAVTNYPGRSGDVQLNLYICEGAPVAGDVLCAGDDGFQDTLVYPALQGEI